MNQQQHQIDLEYYRRMDDESIDPQRMKIKRARSEDHSKGGRKIDAIKELRRVSNEQKYLH